MQVQARTQAQPPPFEEWLREKLKKYHKDEESLDWALKLILAFPKRRMTWELEYEIHCRRMQLASLPADELFNWIMDVVKRAVETGEADILHEIAEVLKLRKEVIP